RARSPPRGSADTGHPGSRATPRPGRPDGGRTREPVEECQPRRSVTADTDSDPGPDRRDPRDGGLDGLDDLAAPRTDRLHKATGLHPRAALARPLLRERGPAPCRLLDRRAVRHLRPAAAFTRADDGYGLS